MMLNFSHLMLKNPQHSDPRCGLCGRFPLTALYPYWYCIECGFLPFQESPRE